jgi:hypothetical protein
MPGPLRPSSDRDLLPKEMLALCCQVGLLPPEQRQALGPLCEQVGNLLLVQAKLLRMAQEAVDQLQLDVKYLLFDLDVTREERDKLRQEPENM